MFSFTIGVSLKPDYSPPTTQRYVTNIYDRVKQPRNGHMIAGNQMEDNRVSTEVHINSHKSHDEGIVLTNLVKQFFVSICLYLLPPTLLCFRHHLEFLNCE